MSLIELIVDATFLLFFLSIPVGVVLAIIESTESTLFLPRHNEAAKRESGRSSARSSRLEEEK